jgi:hypothetical protein
MPYRMVLLGAIFLLPACSSHDPKHGGAPGPGSGTEDAGGAHGLGDGDDSHLPGDLDGSAGSGPCKGLQCQQHACAGGATTTVSGTVYDPAGNNPLYNVVVYVPNDKVQPLKSGASCDACDSLYSGSPIAAAVTDAAGKFTLTKAPDGADIPLVVQIGKWRKQFKIASVAPCQDNPQPDGMLRLPRNRTEGDIPSIAVSTGSADTLECLLRRIGVDAGEYVAGSEGEGRVHIFQGSPRQNQHGEAVAPNTSPAAPKSPDALWNSIDSLMAFDIVLLSCEGQETSQINQAALHEYGNRGGRVFASHFHYSWFNTGPYGSENLAQWSTGSNDLNDIEANIVTKLANGQPFPKGQALADWLGTVKALTNGKLPIAEARHNADVVAANTPSQSWILADENSDAPGASEYLSFNTPTDAPGTADAPYCGRVVYSDLHVGAASGDTPGDDPVPDECAIRKLSPQEAALEFMLFDLSSCVTPDDVPPDQGPPVL